MTSPQDFSSSGPDQRILADSSLEPIDAVISWVDGNDPLHREKRKKYNTPKKGVITGTASTRFNECGEIEFCIVSILKYIPWIRNIFIVTDQQIPVFLDQLKNSRFLKKVKIIDHREIFRGYEEVLPTFNSRSIESCLWRIPGLAEKYIYFNDDFLILKPLKPSAFFRDSKIVLRGTYKTQYSFRFLRLSNIFKKPIVAGHRRAQSLAAELTGINKKFFKAAHVPHPQLKTIQEQFYSRNSEIFENNIKHKFRSREQFIPTALTYHIAINLDLAVVCNKNQCLRLKLDTISLKALEKHLLSPGLIEDYSFMCIQSLDLASESKFEIMQNWLVEHIGPIKKVIGNKAE